MYKRQLHIWLFNNAHWKKPLPSHSKPHSTCVTEDHKMPAKMEQLCCCCCCCCYSVFFLSLFLVVTLVVVTWFLHHLHGNCQKEKLGCFVSPHSLQGVTDFFLFCLIIILTAVLAVDNDWKHAYFSSVCTSVDSSRHSEQILKTAQPSVLYFHLSMI